MAKGFVKLIRSKETEQLLKDDPNAFLLLTAIAYRANWHNDFNTKCLDKGEALIGDYRNYGLTRQEYRGALLRLRKWHFLTVKTTNKGTIAKLIDKRVYDINVKAEQPSKKPSSNHQATTNEEIKNIRTNNMSFQLSELLLNLITQRKPDFRDAQPDRKDATLERWASHIDRMIRIDNRQPERIRQIIQWSQNDSFWQTNILSTEKLRQQFDQLQMKMTSKQKPNNKDAKKCFRSYCDKDGVDYAMDDSGQEFWWCEEHYPYQTPGKGKMALEVATAS